MGQLAQRQWIFLAGCRLCWYLQLILGGCFWESHYCPITIPKAGNTEESDVAAPDGTFPFFPRWMLWRPMRGLWAPSNKGLLWLCKAVSHSVIVLLACWHDNLKNLHFWTYTLTGFHHHFGEDLSAQSGLKSDNIDWAPSWDTANINNYPASSEFIFQKG
jgi:hypothetical protein